MCSCKCVSYYVIFLETISKSPINVCTVSTTGKCNWEAHFHLSGRVAEVIRRIAGEGGNLFILTVSVWPHLSHPCFFFQHPFISQPLSHTLGIELLDKVSNPDPTPYSDIDDDDTESEVCWQHMAWNLSTPANGRFVSLQIASIATYVVPYSQRILSWR